MHLRHYLHSVLGVSWLLDSTPGVSALLSVSRRKQPMSLSLQKPAGLPGLDSPMSGSVARLLDRLKTAIAEMSYEAIIEDLSSPELIGGENSLRASEDVMVVPGHLADTSRPILLAATKGWNGKEPQSFAKVMRQVKARLIESRRSPHPVPLPVRGEGDDRSTRRCKEGSPVLFPPRPRRGRGCPQGG
jgi:hypothetical protein